MTIIAKPIGATKPMLAQNLGCIDQINGIYYFLYQEKETSWTGLYRYNLNDPTKQYSPIKLSMIIANKQEVGGNDACSSNPKTGDIYVWGHDYNDTQKQILLKIKFNASTANTTITTVQTYGNICNGAPESNGFMATYDTKRDYLWLPGTDNKDESAYFYIDVSLGTLDKTIQSKNLNESIDSAQYDQAKDVIVGIHNAPNALPTHYRLNWWNPMTLEPMKSFAMLPGIWCFWTPSYAADFTHNIFYQILFRSNTNCDDQNAAGYLVGLDTNNGSIVSEAQICESIKDCPVPMDLKYWSP
eukprot:333636_1